MNHRAVLFDVNHTLLSIENEADTQEAAIGVLHAEVCKRAGIDIDERAFRVAYDAAWWDRKSSSYETYQEVRYEEIVMSILAKFDITFEKSDLEEILQIYMRPIYGAVALD
jgi:FMN phosphatase YigB (HAD superfamily)